MAENLNSTERQWISKAVDIGIEDYIASRKDKIPAFVARHFSFQGALKIHRKALGKDLIRAPLNVLWVVPTLIGRSSSYLLDKAGADKASKFLERLPPGFETDVQKEINWLIYSELLELPFKQGRREAGKDALLEHILATPELSGKIGEYLTAIHNKSSDPEFRQVLTRNLQEYAGSRAAAADLAGSLINLSSGFIAFNKLTPGALMTGTATAAVIAEKIAIANFWLGPTLGAWYYSVFPATASTGLVVAATGSIIAALALLSTFTGIITDPIQSKLGLHQKRLQKFIDALGDELRDVDNSPYRIKDLYMTRVFDILDVLIAAVKA